MDRRNRIQCLLAAALVFLTHPPLVAASTEAPPQTQITERIPVREPVRLLKAPRPNLPESAATAQYEELSQIENGRVAYEANGVPRRIDGRTSLIFTDTDDESVRAADLQRSLPHLRRMLLAHGTEDLQEVGRRRIYTGGVRITLQESIRGIPVRFGRIELITEARTGRVVEVGGTFVPDRGLPPNPTISAADAVQAAVRFVREMVETGRAHPGEVAVAPTTLSYVPSVLAHPASEEFGRLAWVIPFAAAPEPRSILTRELWIDAVDGSLIAELALQAHMLDRQVHDAAQSSTALFGQHIFSEGGTSGDAIANDTYVNVGLAFSAFTNRSDFNWDSLDGSGVQPENITIHARFGGSPENAGFTRDGTGAWSLRFGDGDPNNGNDSTKPFGRALDVVAHEYGHGIMWFARGLQYNCADCGWTTGGLQEGWADWASVTTERYHGRPNPWTVGKVFLSDASRGYRLAFAPKLNNPFARDWYPIRSLAYVQEGAAHNNATILTHGYYLLVNGGTHYRAGLPNSEVPVIPVSAIGAEKAEKILFLAMTDSILPANANFFDFRYATETVASNLFGSGSSERQSVSTAWDAVGVTPCPSPPPPPVLNVVDQWCYGQFNLTWNPVSTATTYHIQASGSSSFMFPWTTYDAPGNECMQEISGWIWWRIRACNGCGCSTWHAVGPYKSHNWCY